MSLTVSLIAVLIPLLFMGDVVGRLFREFADHPRRHHPDLGGRVADPDADDVRAAPAPHAGSGAGPLLSRLASASSTARSPATGGRCAGCSRASARRSSSPAPTWSSRWSSTSSCRRASSRSQDTGVILGISEAPQIGLVRGDGGAPAGAGARSILRGSGGRRASRPSSASTAPTPRSTAAAS